MHQSETKICQNCSREFQIESEDFEFYEKIKVPPPTFCPECRQQRRMMFRNFKTLYRRNSDRSMKSIISMYSQQKPYKIYSQEEWWKDDWDAKIFGRNFDFNRPFFEQFQELLLAVPKFSIMNVHSQDCEYSNFVFGSKNCYLVFGTVDDEDCAYGHIVWESKDSFDNLYLYKSELCYKCVDCLGSFKLFYCQECENCIESIGLFDCRSCNNCIGCVGLNLKSYHIFNEPVGKEGYKKFLEEHSILDSKTIGFILEKQLQLRKNLPQRYFFGSHNNNVSGNHIYNAHNIYHSFDIKSGEDSKYTYTARKVIDSYDVSFIPNIELSYEALTNNGGSRNYFTHLCVNSNDVYYSDTCFDSHNIFGCVGLKKGEYCILNKQYTKEEYEKMVPKIIEQMNSIPYISEVKDEKREVRKKIIYKYGEFFPPELSPFYYNESIANEYLLLSKEETITKGFRWNDEMPHPVGQETILNDKLPQNPQDFNDELTKHILKCDKCGRNYRLISKELMFYKEMNLPISRDCFNCRHQQRMNIRNDRCLWSGQCQKCGNNFQTSYSPAQQKEFKIYCKACYQSELG